MPDIEQSEVELKMMLFQSVLHVHAGSAKLRCCVVCRRACSEVVKFPRHS